MAIIHDPGSTHGSPGPALPSALPKLLDVGSVAALLDCSTRHVYRLADGGRMPPPVRLGAIVRWNRSEIEAWISGGCKSVRTFKTTGGA